MDGVAAFLERCGFGQSGQSVASISGHLTTWEF
jgi:hypothetical protein